MFSDSRATTTPGEQKGFKAHAPHFIPWLRNSLKAHHSSGDLGLNGAYKSSSEGRNSLTPLERAKGIGFFSIQGKDRTKKGELRCNGMGMLPVVLRGHHILPGGVGKQKEDGPARWNKTKELDVEPSTNTQLSPEEGLADSSSSAPESQNVGHTNLCQTLDDASSPSVWKYGPLVGPHPIPVPVLLAEKPNCNAPVVVCMEDKEGKMWDYTSHTTYRQRDLHSSSWLSSDTQELIERQHGFSSNFTYINKHSRSSQSQRDLTALREPFGGPLNGLVFSTETPPGGLGCTSTLRGPRKPRLNSERIAILGQNQTWVPHRPNREQEPQRKEAGCSRKVVRNQIKRVVDNLEQVLSSLRDIQQEIKEVVQQIDYLTSSIDLEDEEEQRTGGEAKPPSNSSYSSGSSSSEVTVRGAQQRPLAAEDQPGTADSYGTPGREDHSRSQPSQNGQLRSITAGFLSERSRTVRLTCGPSSRKSMSRANTNSLPPHNPARLKNTTTQDHILSPKRSLPARPPTPGLSPLTVNLHHPSSPGSQTPSPLSPKPYPPPALSPSVIIETKVGPYQTPQSDVPSADSLSVSLTHPQSASCPPTNSETKSLPLHDKERRAASAGPSHARTTSTGTAKPPTGQGRRARKPPPYPHHRLSEPTKKVKEPRKAPPYPEKRRLLSTTV